MSAFEDQLTITANNFRLLAARSEALGALTEEVSDLNEQWDEAVKLSAVARALGDCGAGVSDPHRRGRRTLRELSIRNAGARREEVLRSARRMMEQVSDVVELGVVEVLLSSAVVSFLIDHFDILTEGNRYFTLRRVVERNRPLLCLSF